MLTQATESSGPSCLSCLLNYIFDIHKRGRCLGRILKMKAVVDEGDMGANEENRALTRARAGMNLLTPGTPNSLAEERWFHA